MNKVWVIERDGKDSEYWILGFLGLVVFYIVLMGVEIEKVCKIVILLYLILVGR